VKMVARSERVDEEELQMRVSAALVTTSTVPLSFTRAELYATLPCRVLSTPTAPDSRSMRDGVALISSQIVHANDPGVSFKTSRELSHYVIG
jgi:hypothetical protein